MSQLATNQALASIDANINLSHAAVGLQTTDYLPLKDGPLVKSEPAARESNRPLPKIAKTSVGVGRSATWQVEPCYRFPVEVVNLYHRTLICAK
ncbi:hypothetical protein GMORB2_1153 [Geosmithia morbida]|uniref:Uncharacterized protein n=1 Tax=Geosmithia morbida TaxID=1094350 RepID=A0A9P4Z0H7_9HYPO|nr:uncharacterized protein GMORB2_1153 [Geosmithia morbida]KAF4125907.1 hypothetical protein GMORB2_1153 [Geosmithia morbida]